MRKVVDFTYTVKKYVKTIAVNIMPPIVMKGVYELWKALQHPGRVALPNPSEYSTLNGYLEVPSQVEAYLLCRDKYLKPTDVVLDIGFGLAYGLQIMAGKAKYLIGIEVDTRAVKRGCRFFKGHPRIKKVLLYDGKSIPFKDKTFDVVTCVDVIEHVPDYTALILEMIRVSKRIVVLSTPNRRPEYTGPDRKPKNYWHLREWSYEELDTILQRIPDIHIDWNFLNGSWNGPFKCGSTVSEDTLALTPALMLDSSQGWQDDNLRTE